MKNKFISVILFLVLVCSCIRTLPDEKLSMIRTPYSGKEIRLDGCYVSDPDELNKYSEYDFFYSNGVIFALGDILNIKNINQFTGGIDFRSKDKASWGLYHVKDDTISAQIWKVSDDISQYIVQKRFYKIVNDTTLAVDLIRDGDITYYHFKKFTPKPDSTNVFIK